MRKQITRIVWNWYVGANGEEFQESIVGQRMVKAIFPGRNSKECTIEYDNGQFHTVNNVNQITYTEVEDSGLPF